jgi:CRP-like cAMP-binding protein
VPRSATVTATTDLDVLIIGPREFEAMMEIPGFRNALLTGMSRRIREADDRLAAYQDREDQSGTLRWTEDGNTGS